MFQMRLTIILKELSAKSTNTLVLMAINQLGTFSVSFLLMVIYHLKLFTMKIRMRLLVLRK